MSFLPSCDVLLFFVRQLTHCEPYHQETLATRRDFHFTNQGQFQTKVLANVISFPSLDLHKKQARWNQRTPPWCEQPISVVRKITQSRALCENTTGSFIG